MKRAEALKGLSREHQEALVLARRACANETDPHGADARAQCAHLLECWPRFAAHFELEELTLLPALDRAGQGESVAVALRQHAELRALVERIRLGDLPALAEWGTAMAEHVRFEERTLFPMAETVIDPSELIEVMNPSALQPSSSI